ncbi:MAG TPA: acetyl-CoA hydrolase/transferase C-terminal domain-containing protein [Candidatus Kryptonia bacterium]|nr:acetyl-CoA hydrolase/transferase C-terminal domain-containing protein [Candidatus Kryptonia bacterium]
MCLSSVYERKGVRKSRIVTTLTPGNIVTTPRTDVMYVVTERIAVARRCRSSAGDRRIPTPPIPVNPSAWCC